MTPVHGASSDLIYTGLSLLELTQSRLQLGSSVFILVSSQNHEMFQE